MAGGIGIGPVYCLACRLESPIVVLGARTAELVPDLVWPDGADVRITTDDGSRGIRGTALAALGSASGAGLPENAEYYACGPHPMMAAVHRLALESGAPCWTPMEEMMACGVGACQGCAVEMAERTPEGGPTYKRACVEGPVFSSGELAW